MKRITLRRAVLWVLAMSIGVLLWATGLYLLEVPMRDIPFGRQIAGTAALVLATFFWKEA